VSNMYELDDYVKKQRGDIADCKGVIEMDIYYSTTMPTRKTQSILSEP